MLNFLKSRATEMSKAAASTVSTLVAELISAGKKPEPEARARLVGRIAAAFHVHPDEVAILEVVQKGYFLRFIVPEKLKGIGQIPLTSTTALAARTAREKRPEIVNNFSAVRHATVFESVPLSEDRGDPIQKIISAPILLDRKVVGVIQISRKGKNAFSAGADFSPQELRELIATAEVIAPCLPLLASE
jgi:transcriptional regulator with GAF, ATPase, and Fis domain